MRNKKKVFTIITMMLSGIVVTISCTNNKGEHAAVPTISFHAGVLPVFRTSCAIKSSCHLGSNNANEHLDFSDSVVYNTIIANQLVNKITPTASLLYVEISNGQMPLAPYDHLSSSQINLILEWIQQGAKNN